MNDASSTTLGTVKVQKSAKLVETIYRFLVTFGDKYVITGDSLEEKSEQKTNIIPVFYLVVCILLKNVTELKPLINKAVKNNKIQ